MKTIKKILKWMGLVILLLLIAGITAYFIYLRPFMKKMKTTRVIQVDKELTLVLGGGGNSGILVSDSLVMVIDTKMDDAAAQLFEKVKNLAGDKRILVVNTHYHPDHTKGNSFYKGQTIIAGANYGRDFWLKEAGEETVPTQWLDKRMDIRMGDDTATIINFARNAHTASDVFVYLHKRKLLFGGDVILNKQAPALLGNADVLGYLEAFDALPLMFDIKHIVPGHGEIGGMEMIENFRQYFKDMEMAAADDAKKESLLNKYKEWNQVPVFMSPGATVSFIKKHKHSK